MEVCVDSIESAINAEKGGATRVELCANLMEGGTTPTIGTLAVMKAKVKLPVFVMIRPRGGDFLYTHEELDVMKADIINLKKFGADGFVFGILNQDGTVDVEHCKDLLEVARPCPCTFHRAIDMTRDIMEAMESVISLSFDRILTSGGDSTALEGLPTIAEMVKQAGNRIIIMPGGGINERNLERILQGSGAMEFHGSARSSRSSGMLYQKGFVTMGGSLSPPEFSVKVTDSIKVNGLVSEANDVWSDG